MVTPEKKKTHTHRHLTLSVLWEDPKSNSYLLTTELVGVQKTPLLDLLTNPAGSAPIPGALVTGA